ncbi:MAG: ArsR/SmtB family transcription factor [Candidatus Nezhaarchaeales archaeon]
MTYKGMGLLEVLGNETRRRILELLAKEPKYLLQLSKELNVSQQAILKHINILLRAGLIRAYEVKTGSLGPSRKYYELVRPISMTVNVFKGYSEVEIYDINGEVPEDIKNALKTIENAVKRDIREMEAIFSEVKRLIREIDNELREIREKEKALLNAKYRILNLVYEYLRKSGLPISRSRDILESLIGRC